MDSGNSGSLQSSSNGEEEYDSQPEKTSPNFSNNQLRFSSPSNPPLHLSSSYSQDPRSEPKSMSAQGIARHNRTSATSMHPTASKKRTRASRRPPTTVLNTDTSNFRAMVQEFTGIPSSPFSPSTSCSRRFDLFGASPFLRIRPSPQKLQLPSLPYSSSPSASWPLLNNNIITMDDPNVEIINSSNTFNPSTNFCPLPSYSTAHIQGLALSFQPLTHTSKSEGELGLSHFGVSDHPPLTYSQSLRKEPGLSGERQYDSSWFSESYAASSSLSSLQMITNNCKLKFSGSSSEFQHEKRLENTGVSSHGEATVQPWTCPSD